MTEFEEKKASVRTTTVEWIKANPKHPLLHAIVNWTGKRNTDYYDEGYCRIISNLYNNIIALPEEYTSSGSHILYGILSETIVKWAQDRSLIPNGTPFDVLSEEDLVEFVETCRKKFCKITRDEEPEVQWEWKKGDWAWRIWPSRVVLVYEVIPGPHSKVNVNPSSESGSWFPKSDLVPLPIHGEHGIPIPFSDPGSPPKPHRPCDCGVPYVRAAPGLVWCEGCKQHLEIGLETEMLQFKQSHTLIEINEQKVMEG